MVDWAEVQHGARIGAGIGAMTGLIPLGIGIALRQPGNGIMGWIGCVIGGAFAGFIAAIAMMGISIATIFRRRKNPARAAAGAAPANQESAGKDESGGSASP